MAEGQEDVFARSPWWLKGLVAVAVAGVCLAGIYAVSVVNDIFHAIALRVPLHHGRGALEAVRLSAFLSSGLSFFVAWFWSEANKYVSGSNRVTQAVWIAVGVAFLVVGASASFQLSAKA